MPLPLFPYQEEGANVLASHKRFGLHDEMGIGKTAQLIRGINNIKGGRGIVIGPAALRENFIGEYRKFGAYPLKLCKGNNIHDYIAWQRGRFDTLVTSYEQATKWFPKFKDHGEFLDFIIIDEAHFLKTVGVNRTVAIMGKDACMSDCWSEWCEYGWHSTGTPIPNDPADIYTFLRFCGVMPLNYGSFIKRYFFVTPRAFGSRQTVKPEMVGELQALIENNRIRRTKKSIGMQLPPIFLTTFLVDGDASEINFMLREYPGLERAIIMALDQGGLSFLDAQHVATLRRLIGEAKAVPYAHMLLDELRFLPEAKRVVFGVHVNALNYVRDFMNVNGVKAVGIQGATSEKDRIEAVRAFQEDPDCRVFVGNIRAAGVGLTLTASSDLDMLESDWTPAGNAQAIMRVHRIGQQHNVRARFITLAQSFDETVNRVVAEKTAAIAEIEGEAMIASPGGLTAFANQFNTLNHQRNKEIKMQVSFDPTNQDERDAVASIIEALDGGDNGEAKAPKQRRSRKADAPAIPSSLPTPAPVAAVASPAPIAAPQPMPGFTPPAPVAAAAPGMPPLPAFLDRTQQAAPAPVAPVAPAPAPAPVAPVQSSGVTKIQVTQAIQAFTSQYKVAAAKQRLSEFAQAYGLAEPLAIDAIPEAMYAQAVEVFKVG